MIRRGVIPQTMVRLTRPCHDYSGPAHKALPCRLNPATVINNIVKGGENLSYKTLIIDGLNVAFKTFLKLPPLTNSKGMQTGVIFGFLNSINFLWKEFLPKNIILVWDSRKNIRKTIDPSYKSNRKREPDPNFIEFIKQIQIIKESLPKLGIPSIEVDSYECDDIIAILASNRYKKMRPIIIASSDNDLQQLLRNDVHTYNPLSKQKEITTPKSFLKKTGYPHTWVPFYKATAGCTSDAVKGIKGIGPKKVLKMFNDSEFKTDAFLDIIDSLSQEEIDQFNLCLRLVALPLDWDFKGLSRKIGHIKPINIKTAKLTKFFYKYDINALNAKNFLSSMIK